MADQNITELPIKTNSGVASTDYMLGIDSAEGYQILVRDVAKYIVENYNGSALAGPQQSIQSAFQNGTYLLRSGTAITSQADLNNYYNIGNYYCGANAVATSLSNCPVSKAFIMKVEWSSGNGNPRQIIHVYDTYECYIRWTSKLDGTGWSEWVKQPTRTEITELNSKIVFQGGENVTISDTTNGFIDTGIPSANYLILAAFVLRSSNYAVRISNLNNGGNYRVQLIQCVSGAVVKSGTFGIYYVVMKR